MKRTHKLKVLGDVAGVVAKSPNLTVAAKRLGVNRSTLHRWLQAGKVQRAAPKTGVAAGAAAGQTPTAWAKAVRESCALDFTQGVLVDLAVSALELARSPEENAAVRLSAMGRYQNLVRQLDLTSEALVQQPGRPAARAPLLPRRQVADPRSGLMAVK